MPKPISGNPLTQYGMGIFADELNGDCLYISLDHYVGIDIALILYSAMRAVPKMEQAAESIKKVMLNVDFYHGIDAIESKARAHLEETGLPLICSMGITPEMLGLFPDPELAKYRNKKFGH